jgi:hypothetical protein
MRKWQLRASSRHTANKQPNLLHSIISHHTFGDQHAASVMEKRIACIPTGVHGFEERFPGYDNAPRMKAWRCDLTGLSQLYNLYFLACSDEIHVHQPSFPDQNPGSEPELILHPPVSAQTGPGIDSHHPHSITRILVNYLGNEEILLLTCDDGDVVGYRTAEIQRALERTANTLEPANEDDVHVFLHRNVGASAWGLAVHREARIIAIRQVSVIQWPAGLTNTS